MEPLRRRFRCAPSAGGVPHPTDSKIAMKVPGAFIVDVPRRHTTGRVYAQSESRKFYTDLDTFRRCFHTKPRSGFHCGLVTQGPPITTPSWYAFRCRDEEASGAVRSLRTEDHSAMTVTC